MARGSGAGSTFDITPLDTAGKLYEETWNVVVDDPGVRRQFHVIEQNRALRPTEFLGFISERPDFEFIGWWEDWDLDRPITAESQTTRPLTLVRRLSPGHKPGSAATA